VPAMLSHSLSSVSGLKRNVFATVLLLAALASSAPKMVVATTDNGTEADNYYYVPEDAYRTEEKTDAPVSSNSPTTDSNPFGCYIYADNPGYIQTETNCQFPFTYRNWQSEVYTYDYPPTIAEARPYGIDSLSGVTEGDTTMRWCPPLGTVTYNVRASSKKKKWGAVKCLYTEYLPTPAPTLSPTLSPTNFPTQSPTKFPTDAPTKYPTKYPTDAPTLYPTNFPTDAPTKYPTMLPTVSPTMYPTLAPTDAPTTLEYGQRDLYCKTFFTVDDCSLDTWHTLACRWTDNTCRARQNTQAPTLFPTSAPSHAPTIPDTQTGSSEDTDAEASGGLSMTMIIVIAGVVAGVTAIVLVVSLVAVRRNHIQKRRTSNGDVNSIAMTSYTGGPGGSSAGSSTKSPPGLASTSSFNSFSDWGVRASTKLGNLRGYFSNNSGPEDASNHLKPITPHVGNPGGNSAFQRYDSYDDDFASRVPPPPPMFSPKPTKASRPPPGIVPPPPPSSSSAAANPAPPNAPKGIRPPPGLGFVSKFSSRFSRHFS